MLHFVKTRFSEIERLHNADWILSEAAKYTVKERHLNIVQRRCKWSSFGVLHKRNNGVFSEKILGWGMYTFLLCILILDINCQHLGNICQLEGFCAPFGRGVRKSKFFNIYICIGYLLPTFGEYTSLGGFLCALRAQGGKCTFLNIWYIIYLYWI